MPNITSKTHTLNADGDYVIKYGQLESRPYTLIIHLEDAAADGTITVGARPQGSSAAIEPIPYQSLHLNGSAGTGALVTTAITDDSLIAVEADGLEIVLSLATHTTGSYTASVAFASLAS
jgi:hypothetical protein